MLDQLSEIYKESVYLLPVATFFIGFMGSVHCVGMCGGLVMACTPKPQNNISYQLGRLGSYSVLAIIAGYFGSLLKFDQKDPYLTLIPALFIGGMFIWFGLRAYFSNSVRVKNPMQNRFLKLWQKALPKNPKEVSLKSSFTIGALSIFLPCAFLYGVILALGAFQSPIIALVCIISFWAGTLPIMAMAPTLIKKIFSPLQKRLPLMTSSFLILLGVGTIAHRVYQTYQAVSCCH